MREISTSKKRSDEALIIALPGLIYLSYLIFPPVLQQISIQILHIIEKALIPQVIVDIFGGEALQLPFAINYSLNSIIYIVKLPQGICPLCELHQYPPQLARGLE
jgi:hypothetical protein